MDEMNSEDGGNKFLINIGTTPARYLRFLLAHL
jgi:hypothetical protein